MLYPLSYRGKFDTSTDLPAGGASLIKITLKRFPRQNKTTLYNKGGFDKELCSLGGRSRSLMGAFFVVFTVVFARRTRTTSKE